VQHQRSELAHASGLAVVGELTASIAHEINQPLGAILSNADAAELLLESGAPHEPIRHILEDIRQDDLRASEVIRRLRALLRKHEIETRPFDLNEAIADALRVVRAEAERRHVAVDAELAALPIVRGDRTHLQQVLLNLIVNGMDAMADITFRAGGSSSAPPGPAAAWRFR
jgi:C4-dicarboxylate-specific signal transduction histidine kinase